MSRVMRSVIRRVGHANDFNGAKMLSKTILYKFYVGKSSVVEGNWCHKDC